MKFNIEFLNEKILDREYFGLPFSLNRNWEVWRNEEDEVVVLIQGRGLDNINNPIIEIELFEVKFKGDGYKRECIGNISIFTTISKHVFYKNIFYIILYLVKIMFCDYIKYDTNK